MGLGTHAAEARRARRGETHDATTTRVRTRRGNKDRRRRTAPTWRWRWSPASRRARVTGRRAGSRIFLPASSLSRTCSGRGQGNVRDVAVDSSRAPAVRGSRAAYIGRTEETTGEPAQGNAGPGSLVCCLQKKKQILVMLIKIHCCLIFYKILV